MVSLSNNIRKDPHSFATSITENSLDDMIDYVFEILSTTYICIQFGYQEEMTEQQQAIVSTHGKKLGERLGIVLSDDMNEKIFVWSRKNLENYNWIYNVWVLLNTKYYDLNRKNHEKFKYTLYFFQENLFKMEN